MKTHQQALSSMTQNLTESSVEAKNGLPLQASSQNLLTQDEILLRLKRVNDVSRLFSPERAVRIMENILALNLTREEFEQACARYEMSLASQFREIQLSDFTNTTITSERELREKVKALDKREKELDERIKQFNREVERAVDKRLQEITIDLKREIAAWLPDEKVTAINALYRAIHIVKKQREEAIMAQVPKWIEEINEKLNKVYNDLKSNLTA